MKPIRSVLKMVSKQAEHDIPAVDKFLKSKRGQAFILKLDIKNITLLEREMHAPALTTPDPIQRLGLWRNRAKALKLLPDKIPYELHVKEVQAKDAERGRKAKNGSLKLPMTLGHYARKKAFMQELVRNADGSLVQAMDKKGRLLWRFNAKGEQSPIYKRKAVSGAKNGFLGAVKVNSYIAHSVEKWEKKNPQPISMGPLFSSQFAEEFAAWQTQRNIFREYIAKVMTDRYGHQTTNKTPMLRLYAVHKKERSDNNTLFYEQECTEPLTWGYPLCGIRSITDAPLVHARMPRLLASHMNDNIVKLKLYSGRGNLLYEQAA